MEVLALLFLEMGTILAVSDERRELVRQAAKQLVKVNQRDIRPRDVADQRSYR